MRALLLVAAGDGVALAACRRQDPDTLVLDLAAIDPDDAEPAAATLAALSWQGGAAGLPTIWARTHPLATGLVDRDLDRVMAARPAAILLPGTVGGRDVQHLAAKLAVHEAVHGIPDGATGIVAVAGDTAAGLLAIGAVPGSSPRLRGIAWGFSGGASPSAGEGTAASASQARAMTLIAAQAAGVPAIDAAEPAGLGDEAFAQACAAAARDGFAAKLAAEPRQVAAIRGAAEPCPDRSAPPPSRR